MPFRKSRPWGQIKPPVGSVVDGGDPINTKLVGRWLLNENGGMRLKSLVNGGSDGVLTNFASPPTATSGWVPGKFGPALAFDGTNDNVVVSSGSRPMYTGALAAGLTLACYFQPTTTLGNSSNKYLLASSDTNVRGNQTAGALYVRNGVSALFLGGVIYDGAYQDFISTTAVSPNVEHHAALVVSPALSLLILYLDGVNVGTQAYNPAGTDLSTANYFNLGSMSQGGGNYYNARASDFSVYKRALSLAEIKRLCAEPFAGIVAPRRRVISQVITGIQFDAASNSGYQTAQSTYSWNHNCSGSNRLLRVGVSMLSAAGISVSGITYNGVALSLVRARASTTGTARAELWELVAPATGTNSIAVTLSGSLDSVGGAISLTGVDQTTPSEAANDNANLNLGPTDATVAITTVADGDWITDVLTTNDTAATVAGSGQTMRSSVTGTLGLGGTSTFGPKTPAGSYTMDWNNIGSAKTWAIVAAAVRPVQVASAFVGDDGELLYYRRIIW